MDINWLSMALSTLIPLVIGFIYYHQNVFGSTLPKPSPRSNQQPRILAIIPVLLFSFFLSFFFLNFNNDGINQEGDFDNFQHGAWHGFFVAVTVVFPVVIVMGYFLRISWKNILIHLFYWLLTLPLMGGIMDAMNHWDNITLPQG